MVRAKVAVITGANRGIGLAICESLASTTGQPLVVYAVSRAGKQLDIDPKDASVSFRYASMSLTNRPSMTSLASRVHEEQGGCDVLINNAGVYHYDPNLTAAQRRETVDVNYRGTLAMCQAFLPVLNKDARIVNVSSDSGNVKQFGPQLRARFRDPKNRLEDIEKLALEYEEAASNGTDVANGWARKPYFVSKALETAMTMALAHEEPSFYINACCPGWVSTDLGNQAGAAPKTVEEGARVPIHVAFGDIGGVTGQWWANARHSDTGVGAIQEW